MADCDNQKYLMAYSDGELDSSRRAEVERHLESCPACAAELAQLRALSSRVEAELSSISGLSQIARHRVHKRLDAVMDEGVVRAARIISAIAACVLAGATGWLMHGGEVSTAPPPWVEVATQTDTSGSNAVAVEDSSPAAAWYLASASGRSDDSP